MNKKSIENEAKRISNELLKKNNYNESFDNLISNLIDKKYNEYYIKIIHIIIKILSNSIEIEDINNFKYTYKNYNLNYIIFLTF